MREPPRRSTVGAAPPLLLLRPGSWTRGGAAALGAGSGGSGAGRGRARRPSRPAARTARWAALLWRCRPEGEGRVPEEAAGVRVRGRGAGAAPQRAWRPQVRAEASGGHPSANFPPRAEGGSLAGAATLCWDRGRQPRDGTPGHLCRCGRCSRGTGQRRAGRAHLRSRCHCWPQASVSRTSRRGRGGRCGGCTAQLSAGAGEGGAPLSGPELLHAGHWGALQGHQHFWSWQREDTQETGSVPCPLSIPPCCTTPEAPSDR